MANNWTFVSKKFRSVHCFSLQFQSKLQSKSVIFPEWFKRPVVQNWTNRKCRMIRKIGSIILTRNADLCMWGRKTPVSFPRKRFWNSSQFGLIFPKHLPELGSSNDIDQIPSAVCSSLSNNNSGISASFEEVQNRYILQRGILTIVVAAGKVYWDIISWNISTNL